MIEYNIDRLFQRWLSPILRSDSVAVPDDEEEMNWRLFFAHSQDMQGFRADIFTGGRDEGPHPFDPSFVGLRDAWLGNSRSLIADLAAVWEDETSQQALKALSQPHGGTGATQPGVRAAIDLLHASAVPGAQTFAWVLDRLRGARIAYKTKRMIRAYLQNSFLLSQHACSFRAYLRHQTPGQPFPPRDAACAEKTWVRAVERDFYGVGPALANYMVCDWLLWLWREGRIDWFESWKPDSVHHKAVEAGWLPESARDDFVAYSRSLRIPAGYGALSGKPCPPRILNECIWLELQQSTSQGQMPATERRLVPEAHSLTVPVVKPVQAARQLSLFDWPAAEYNTMTPAQRRGEWRGDQPPVLDAEDEAILDRVWATITDRDPHRAQSPSPSGGQREQ